MDKKNLAAIVAMLITTAIWGFAGPVIKATLSYYPPFTLLFWRFFMVVIFTLPWYLWYLGSHPLKKRDLLFLSFDGVLATTINLGLIFIGFNNTSAIEGTLISALSPIFIILLGWLFLKEKVNKLEIVGLAVVIIGSIITIVQPIFFDGGFTLKNTFGNLMIILADIEWAFYILLVKKNADKYHSLQITLHGSIIAFLTFIPLAIWENHGHLPSLDLLVSNGTSFWGIFYMAIFSYFIGYFLFNWAMSRMDMSRGSIFSYLQPVFAAPVAVLWLKEPLTLPFLVGALIITVGVILSEWKK